MKASRAVEIFSAMSPDTEVWVTYFSKEDLAETFEQLELSDENGNLIDTKPFVTEYAIETVGGYIDNDDYLWERFGDTVRDTAREVLDELIAEKKIAETDTELWDKEITDESK